MNEGAEIDKLLSNHDFLVLDCDTATMSLARCDRALSC